MTEAAQAAKVGLCTMHFAHPGKARALAQRVLARLAKPPKPAP